MNRPLNPLGTYYAYLRKSRADRDAEAHGEGETLLRHEKILEGLSSKLGITISKFYREIVSGETIQDRPVVQELLQDISNGKCDGVLVVEVERLARGDTSDQGTIAKYFKFSDTLIITPLKIFDPTDEYDEEYFEFGLFMSRREYKTINRRIQRGRIASVQEGKWIASTAPYGYERIKIPGNKGYTLQIIPEQAEIVRLVFHLYLYGEKQPDGSSKRLGRFLICKKLDAMGIKPAVSEKWSVSTIKDMLQNPVYIGKVCWGKDIEKKVITNGTTKKIRIKNPDFQMYDGLHPAIIPNDIFSKAQELAHSKAAAPITSNKILKNPLSGIIKCGKCGSLLTRAVSNTKDNYYNLRCPNRDCDNVSAPLYLIEQKLLEALRDWLEGYELEWEKEGHAFNESVIKENSLHNYEKELQLAKGQQERTYDLLEQGIYTPDVFQSRLKTISDKIQAITTEISNLKRSIEEEQKIAYALNTFIPRFRHILDVYFHTESILAKNEMLKSILDHAEYTKEERNRKFSRDNANFKLTIYPKLPKH